jgi:hypothetical protein
MSGGRVAGGVLSLIGGAFIVLVVLINIDIVITGLPSVETIICWFLALVVGVLGLVGGILGLTSKRSGGGLALAAGIIAVVVGVIWFISPLGTFFDLAFPIFQYSVIVQYISTYWGVWFGVSIEGFLILIGGIVILASGD